MRYIDKIIIHCSDSTWGNAINIEKWHKEIGFRSIGYSYIITNGYISPENFDPLMDGVIESGRPIQIPGAHCKGQNNNVLSLLLNLPPNLTSVLVLFPQKSQEQGGEHNVDDIGPRALNVFHEAQWNYASCEKHIDQGHKYQVHDRHPAL